MQTVAFSKARAELAETINRAEQNGEPVIISRHGENAAVVLSFGLYQEMIAQRQGFGARLARWRSDYADLSEENPFDNVRSKESGREFAW